MTALSKSTHVGRPTPTVRRHTSQHSCAPVCGSPKHSPARHAPPPGREGCRGVSQLGPGGGAPHASSGVLGAVLDGADPLHHQLLAVRLEVVLLLAEHLHWPAGLPMPRCCHLAHACV